MLDSFYQKASARIKVLLAWFSRPSQLERSLEEKKKLSKETSGISLYDYKWCANSLNVRDEIHHLNIDIELRDVRKCSIHQDNLLAQFGQIKVPSLRIEEKGEVRWLDESDEIVEYLHQRFSATKTPLSSI